MSGNRSKPSGGNDSVLKTLLDASREIEQAALGLLHPEAVFQQVCQEVQSLADFDFAALQLIRPDEEIIETVCGTGQAADLAGRSRHALEDENDLRDIQADIALANPPRAEALAGYDDRFDKWIYETSRHDELVRAFVPVFLVRDQSGHVVEGEKLDAWIGRWRTKVVQHDDEKDRRRLAVEIQPVNHNGEDWMWEVIGTMEAGYTDRDRRISSEQVVALAQCASKLTPRIYRVLLLSVLHDVARFAAKVLPADYASLHFDYLPDEGKYVYSVISGTVTQSHLNRNPPRKKGLGRKAIREGRTLFIPDQNHGEDELRKVNPRLYKLGIRAVVAMPLPVKDKEGVLYVGFKNAQTFTEQQIGSIRLFANLAVDAISHAMMCGQVRNHARLLESIHSVAESLADKPNDTELLRRIAWESLNILAADVVTIYEYHQRQNVMKTPPVIAGRLLHAQNMVTEIDPEDAPALLVQQGQPVFAAHSPVKHDILNRERQRPPHKGASFVERERIMSTAAIPLKVQDETVGLMFINYRRTHPFADEDKKLILTLASSAAIAIRNRRLLEVLHAHDKLIVAERDAQRLFECIVEDAVDITGAEVAEIFLLDLPLKGLLSRAQHIGSSSNGVESVREGLKQVALDVTAHGELVLRKGSSINPAAPSSTLGVPLLDGGKRVLGALTLAHTESDLIQHCESLKPLAVKAVLAIQSGDSQKRRIASENLATLGHVATTFLHKWGNDLAAINFNVKSLQASQAASSEDRENVDEIQKTIAEIMEEIVGLRAWRQEERKPLNLRHVVTTAMDRVPPPTKIKTKVDVDDSLPRVMGEQGQLIEVLINLIHNAEQAMNEKGGTLTVSASCTTLHGRNWLLLRICDTGKGMDESQLEKIGNRGYTERKGGLGYGAWLARTYIEMLEGKIDWTSQPGKGTEVVIALPPAIHMALGS